ncbi:hypothetical protein SAMN02745136_00794 [Anaerocolumna jejuensis DSM 15929]|uniref:Uncharacterized protein n=1 Tax=Anaerocolumna jejuensis DSM 15929 TaxID=1121322 RepID=A0A1M6M124_9FIRM|nr:hypothetical protein [Anaerocolumna jejuensis]SHJ77134.1 hypothetical protein SAMN02745136_00794 [Anaerocolumna jejuensis DSM 15929]
MQRKLLIASVFLNIIFLSLFIILGVNHYTNQSAEAQVNKLVTEGAPISPSEGISVKGTPVIVSGAEKTAVTNNSAKLDSTPYYYSDLMENPIDQAYLSLVTDQSYCQIEFRNFQERYYEIWEEEYHKVLNILKNKAEYPKDKEDIEKFDKNVEKFYENNKDFFESAVLKDYSTDPSLPEKNSWGNGTRDKLIEIKGKLYRDACIQIITLLEKGDYNFPEKVDFIKESSGDIEY